MAPSISIFDLFKIGIGPSSSHTVGPMLAARAFVANVLQSRYFFESTSRITIDLYGSLALTGKGHGTDLALLLGLEGNYPDQIDPAAISAHWQRIQQTQRLNLLGQRTIAFCFQRDLILHLDQVLPYHANGLRITAYTPEGTALISKEYYSIGGGFILSADEIQSSVPVRNNLALPYPYSSAAQLMEQCHSHHLTIAQLIYENEKQWRSPADIQAQLNLIWETMQACVVRGFQTDGYLPGQLKVRRRAPDLYRRLSTQAPPINPPLFGLDWVNAYALAVSEENAAGGRIVTAPTNGAAGIIPAVMHYYTRFFPNASPAAINDFLLTAAAIGILYKNNASISGAEVGCQGEIGVACSMAAAGLAAVLGGQPEQVENAAEIGMEHNLGLTCDPVAGLVQIPCIERNAMGAVKAINAAHIALHGNGKHSVSLDKVIQTMRVTGQDMHDKYKETSRGGLAVSLVGC